MPLLLIEILLVMMRDEDVYQSKAWALVLDAALMIVSGYYVKLEVTFDFTPRWT